MTLTTEQKVGLFFLAALVVLAVMIELVEDWRPFETQVNYYTFFRSAVGIKVGDPVRLAGVEVGRVRSIRLEGPRVRVDFYVVSGTDVRQDSLASIRQMNLLGGQFLGLEFGSPESPQLAGGAEIPSVEGANIDQLITHLDQNQERVFGTLGHLIEESRTSFVNAVSRLESIAGKIDSGAGSLGRLVNDPTLYDELTLAVSNVKQVVERLETGEGSLGRLLNDPALYDQVSQVAANLQEISTRLKAGEGSLGKLLTEDRLYNDASDALASIRDISGKISRGDGTLGKLVNEEDVYRDTREAVARIASIAAKIDEGSGTLGHLVNDDDLYRDVKTTLHKVEKAADGLSDSGTVSALGTVVGTLF